MRLTKQYAYALFTSIPADKAVATYYELTRVAKMMDSLSDDINVIEFQPEEFTSFREVLTDEVDSTVLNFLEVLAFDRMLSRLNTISEDYRMVLIEENRLYDVKVFSAVPLSAEAKTNIEQLVERRWGKDYLLDYRVNKKILGGIRLEVNGAIIDTTFRSRIDQIIREVQHGSKR